MTQLPIPEIRNAADSGDTRTRILDAAFRCLATQGYAALSVREIARDAGVNHALISYYFGGRDRLVIAVLDEANRQLLQRQRQMYDAPGRFADKWAQARRFYENDVASGFVRVQAELYAASLSNPDLRRQFVPRLRAWKQVVLDAVRDALATSRPALPSAFDAEAIATLVSEFWLGMEFARLMGDDEERRRHDKALDAVESLLRVLDARAGEEPPSRSVAKPIGTTRSVANPSASRPSVSKPSGAKSRKPAASRPADASSVAGASPARPPVARPSSARPAVARSARTNGRAKKAA